MKLQPDFFEAQAAFESIESAQEYLALLAQAVLEAKQGADIEIEAQMNSEALRRVEALRMISYNLEKLERHVKVSRRILNDFAHVAPSFASGTTTVDALGVSKGLRSLP